MRHEHGSKCFGLGEGEESCLSDLRCPLLCFATGKFSVQVVGLSGSGP